MCSIYELLINFKELEFLSNNIAQIKSGYDIGYFLMGYYLDKYEISNKHKIILYICAILCVGTTIVLVINDCVNSQSCVERYWNYKLPLISIASCAWFVFVKSISYQRFRKIMRLVADISKKSLGIYGIHMLFIIISWKIGLTTTLFNGILSVPIISLTVGIFSYIASVFIKHIPILGMYLV